MAANESRSGQRQDSRPRQLNTSQPSILLELTRSQIDEVLRQTGESGVMSLLLLRGRFDSTLGRELEGSTGSAWVADAGLSRSLLLGLWVLSLLPAPGSWKGVSDIARSTGLSKSSTHRYLNTLLEVGLAERSPESRKYRLPALGGWA
jgi:DNA-binding transcriptional ArsR family regulator